MFAIAVVRPLGSAILKGTIVWGVGEALRRRFSNQQVTITVTPIVSAAA